MQQEQSKKATFSDVLRAHFTAPRIAYMAVFTALAFVVTFLEFPVFPSASFLKLDFANLFFMIEGFIFGPVEAIVSILIKELLCLIKSSSGGVGEVANFIMSTAYVIVPAIGYRFKKGRKWVVLFLAIACAIQIGISLLVNRYINFPLFMGSHAAEQFEAFWPFILYFNIIKSISISVLVLLIYKPLSKFIKMTSAKFGNRKKKRSASEDGAAALAESAEPSGESAVCEPNAGEGEDQNAEEGEKPIAG